MGKIAIKVNSRKHGMLVIEYLEKTGGINKAVLTGESTGSYYFIGHENAIYCGSFIPEGYTEISLPEESQLSTPIDLFRAKAALMCLSFYEVEDEERFSKAVRDADRLIQELNK